MVKVDDSMALLGIMLSVLRFTRRPLFASELILWGRQAT